MPVGQGNIGYKRVGINDYLLMAITELIIGNSVRVRMLRDRLKCDQMDSFSDIDHTFDDSVIDRASIEMSGIIEDL